MASTQPFQATWEEKTCELECAAAAFSFLTTLSVNARAFSIKLIYSCLAPFSTGKQSGDFGGRICSEQSLPPKSPLWGAVTQSRTLMPRPSSATLLEFRASNLLQSSTSPVSWRVWHPSMVKGFRGTWDPQDQDVCDCLPIFFLHISPGQFVEVTSSSCWRCRHNL